MPSKFGMRFSLSLFVRGDSHYTGARTVCWCVRISSLNFRVQIFLEKISSQNFTEFPHCPITSHHLHQRWAGVEGYPKQEIAQVRQGSAHQVSQEGRMGLCRHRQAARSAGEAAEVKNRPSKRPSKNTYKCVIPVPSAPHEDANEVKMLSKAFQALTNKGHCSGAKSQPSRGHCRT